MTPARTVAALGLAVLAFACAPLPAVARAPHPPAPSPPPAVPVQERIVSPEEGGTAAELLALARLDYEAGRCELAEARLRRVLAAETKGESAAEALYYEALCEEALGRHESSARTFSALYASKPRSRFARDAAVRASRLWGYLDRWSAAGDAARFASERFASELVPNDQVAVYSARALAALYQGASDEAEYWTGKARVIVEANSLDSGGLIARALATKLDYTRYDCIVQDMGGHGEYVEDPSTMRGAIDRAFASGRPALVNVKLGHSDFRKGALSDEHPPRFLEALATAHGIIGRRPELRAVLACLAAGRNVLLEGPVGVEDRPGPGRRPRPGAWQTRVDGDGALHRSQADRTLRPPRRARTRLPGRPVDPRAPGRGHAGRGDPVRQRAEPHARRCAERIVAGHGRGPGHRAPPRTGAGRPRFRPVATQNPREFVATGHLSEALLDRFELGGRAPGRNKPKNGPSWNRTPAARPPRS